MTPNTELEKIKNRFIEKVMKREEVYNTYYRIPHDYKQTIQIDVLSGKAMKVVNEKHDESLSAFKGVVISRIKEGGNKRESKFRKYWKYSTIAMQDTCIESILDYSEQNKLDFWTMRYVEIVLHFYSAKKQSYCKVFNLKEIDESEFVKNFENRLRRRFGN
jgi:hypothetical protein